MLTFKQLSSTDIVFFTNVRNSCAEYLHDDRKFEYWQVEDWFETLNSESNKYYIINLDDEPVGYFRLSNFTPTNCYIGCDIHSNYRGKGIAYAAYKIFIHKLFSENKYNKLFLEVLSTNTIAISLYLKLGFKFEGIKRDLVYRNGRYIDSYIMSLYQNESL